MIILKIIFPQKFIFIKYTWHIWAILGGIYAALTIIVFMYLKKGLMLHDFRKEYMQMLLLAFFAILFMGLSKWSEQNSYLFS